MNDQKSSAMQAFRLYGHITHEHKLEIDLPTTIQEGPAEVIVFTPERSNHHQSESLEDFLNGLKKEPRTIKTKEEIDRGLESERNSWG
jgi:hypothetical protein